MQRAVAMACAALAATLGLVAQGAAQCCGDCNVDGEVTVNELVTAVNRALTSCSDDGICGAAGVRGLERVEFSARKADSNSPKKAFAKCPSGKQVIAGGAKILIAGAPTGPVAVKASFPVTRLMAGRPLRRRSYPRMPKWYVTAFALCTTVTP